MNLGTNTTLTKDCFKVVHETELQFGITNFYYNPCPKDTTCISPGKSIEFRYPIGEAVQQASELYTAFGYRIEVLETNYQTYAIVRIHAETAAR